MGRKNSSHSTNPGVNAWASEKPALVAGGDAASFLIKSRPTLSAACEGRDDERIAALEIFLLRRFRLRHWRALMKHRQPLAIAIGPDGRVTCLIRIHPGDLHCISNQRSVMIELHSFPITKFRF